MNADLRRDLLAVFEAGVEAVNGANAVRRRLEELTLPDSVWLIAYGKAACAMARGAHEALGDHIREAFVATKRGAAEPLPWPVLEAGHPLPDEASLAAGLQLEKFCARIPREATVLMLLSGGGSALVESLPPGFTLDDLQALNRWLLGSGFDIHAMNAVRKRLSRLKGGRLAALLAPRHVVCLAISDVAGDDPRAIASGPLVADERGALPDLARMPARARAALQSAPPLPRADDACFAHVRFEIVATNDHAKQAAAGEARRRGYTVAIEPEFLSGDALLTGADLARRLLADAAGVLRIWGGETTVVLPDRPARGGRSQALALSAALTLAGHASVWLLAAGTDGSDGPTEDAGALVDGDTVARGVQAGLDARAALAATDAGTFLEASGDLVHTGPTGTNVMDLVLGLRA